VIVTTNENAIEQKLIAKLCDLKYTYRADIRDRASLERNFRAKFEELNRVNLTDSEFSRLLDSITTPDVFAAAKALREQNTFEREDGTFLHYTLVNIKDWCKNTFEVINQVRMNTEYTHHRYDVILLINGVPVVQIELKTLGISPRRAMQQIVDYKNDTGNGYTKTLLCFMQLFIVSNRERTYYFANNNNRHFAFDADERFLPVYQYAAPDNRKIGRLDEFAETMLAKCTLGQMISRYMVLMASEQKLMMMRPYQIYAVKAIMDCIQQNCGNGYIWHTTGSGKTLTSFKASTLLKDNPNISKCLFVVDRKDLDRQTREEFNRFQEKCVEENTNTANLVTRLLSEDYADKVIVTTIQKLGIALDPTHRKNYKEQLKPLRDQRIVFIFDECHRSQFGENHRAIKEFFPNAQLFGFTGTPIFGENASKTQIEGDVASLKTTKDIFQHQLHTYTITHAIEDQNVLRFHVDYFKPEGKDTPKQGEALAKKAIIEAILTKHDAATAGRKFNAILATASIPDAIEYYGLLKTMQAEKQAADPTFKPLSIACVFSPPADGDPDVQQIQEDLITEREDNKVEPEKKKSTLKAIIADYNATFGTNHTVGEFDLYYKDIQKRIKDQQYPLRDLPPEKRSDPSNRKIDITIVVDMLLTGFDSKYLNTLYVDKNLKYHGLIQAFSRTNRVLNDSKPYGNILDFRQQRDAVDVAIILFSGEQGDKAKKIWLVEPAPVVVSKLQEAVKKLDLFMQSQGLTCTPDDVNHLKGDAARILFIERFKEVQKLTTQLAQYTDKTPEIDAAIEAILPPDQLQAFRGVYLEMAKRLKDKQDKEHEKAAEDVQQLDFEFVLFASAIVDYDYIMGLIARYSQEKPGDKQRMSREQLVSLIMSDAKFMEEREDIVAYIDTLKVGEGLDEKQIMQGYERFKNQKNAAALAAIADGHGIGQSALQVFVDTILTRLIFDGELLSDLFADHNLPWKERTDKELALMADLVPLLKKRAKGREISGLAAYEQ
jgi:type I restriction enzyme R subunit